MVWHRVKRNCTDLFRVRVRVRVFVAENGMCFMCVLSVRLCLSDSEMQIECKQLPFTLAFTPSYSTSTNIALAENDVV